MKETNLYRYCNVVGNTDVGCKRKANEDYFGHFKCSNGWVSVVCDGMGGHVGGATASHLAVGTIKEFLENNYFDDPCNAIIEACNAANAAILNRTAQQPELTGMGSTCVMLIVRDGKVYIGSIGDSRIYFLRSKRLKQLTKDQSYVQMLVDHGEITKEAAEKHPRRNEITNALGLPSMQPATVQGPLGNLEAGDCFLLCSDGLSGMVSDHVIEKVLSNQAGMNQQERVDELIRIARKNGGNDNITCLIVEFAMSPSSAGCNFDKKKRIILHYILPCLAAILLLGIGGYPLWKHFQSNNESTTNVVVSESDIEKNIGTISYTPNDTIEICKDFEGRTYIKFKNDIKEYVNCSNIKRDSIFIEPLGCFSKYETETSSLFVFNDKSIDDKSLRIYFANCDTIYCIKLKPNDSSDREKDESFDTVGTENRGEEMELREEGVVKGIVSDPVPKIKVKKDSEEHIIKLIKGKGSPNNDTVYCENNKVKIEKNHRDSTKWYSYEWVKDNVCNIIVKGVQMPKDTVTIEVRFSGSSNDSYKIEVIKEEY